MKISLQGRLVRVSAVAVAAIALVIAAAPTVDAAGLTSKSLRLTNSTRSATAGHTYTFTAGTAANVQCVQMTYSVTRDGAASDTPAQASGVGASPTVSNMGTGGTWAATKSSTGVVRVTNASNTGNPSAGASVALTGIVNGASTGTYYVRVATFGNVNCSTSPVDSDVVAFTIGDSNTTTQDTSVAVTGTLGETLTLQTNTTTAALGNLSPSQICSSGAGSCPTSVLTVSTNAVGGYTLYGQGSALSNGSQTIPWSTNVSSPGTSGFTVNQTACTAGATCVSSDTSLSSQSSVMNRSAAANADAITVLYKAAVGNTQAPGTYTTTINYVATGQF